MVRWTAALRRSVAQEVVAALAAAIDRFGREERVPSLALAALHVAIDEVAANVVDHSCGESEVCTIELELRRDGDAIEAQFVDDGVSFDPLATVAPPVPSSLAECDLGGLGIHLIRRLMDEVKYEHREGRNWLVLRKTC